MAVSNKSIIQNRISHSRVAAMVKTDTASTRSTNQSKAHFVSALVGMTSLEKYDMAKAGVTKKSLESIKDQAALDYDTLARGLGTARATLINVKGKKRFNPQLSEKIVGLA